MTKDTRTVARARPEVDAVDPERRRTSSRTEQDEMLTVREICAELKISRQTIYEWWAKGRGPKRLRLPNGEIRVYRSDLETFLAKCLELA